MFTPNQQKAASELVRVVRRGGKIGLASWTPDGFIGQILKLVGRYAPPPAGLKPSTAWGEEARLRDLFPGQEISVSEQTFVFRYESADHWLHVFRTCYGPLNRAFAALEADRASGLEAEILELLERTNSATHGGLTVPAAYLEVVIVKA